MVLSTKSNTKAPSRSDSGDSSAIAEITKYVITGQPISEKLQLQIYDMMDNYNPSKTNLKTEMKYWDLFHALFVHPDEAANNYWLCTYIAGKLMLPKIEAIARKAKDSSRCIDAYGNTKDIEHNCLLTIQANIKNYNPETSKFPMFIANYLVREGYIFERDISPYLEKVKGYRFYQIEHIAAKNSKSTGINDDYDNSDAILYNNREDNDDNENEEGNEFIDSPEEMSVKQEKQEMFNIICDICGIEVEDSTFITDFNEDKDAACNFVIASKFLGGIDDEVKQTCLRFVSESDSINDKEFDYE